MATDKAATKKEAKGARRPARKHRAEAAVDEESGIGSANAESADVDDGPEIMPEVGSNLRRVRAARSMSLETLARASGVSRAMLSQIELGHSTPTIKLLWKVARALDLPFSALLSDDRGPDQTTILRGDRARRLTSSDGRFSSRALFPANRPRRAEFYELRLAIKGVEEAEPHPPGTCENLIVHKGSVEIRVAGGAHQLDPGDAIQFQADVPHTYKNTGATDAIMYLVMSYPEAVLASPTWQV